MKEMKYKLPNDAESVTVKVEDGYVVALYEPKKEFKFGDYVRVCKNYTEVGIVLSKCDNGNYEILETDNHRYYVNSKLIKEIRDFEIVYINRYLKEYNLVIDYEKKEIRKKRWRAEINGIYFHIGENGIVIKDMEFFKADDYRYEIGNYFRTREQAESVAKEVKEVFEKHKND